MSEYFRNSLDRRARRLSQLIEVNAPPQMVGKEVSLIVQAAIGFCPNELSTELGQWLIAAVRKDAGLCVGCECKLPNTDHLCAICKEKAESEEESIKTYT